MIASTAGLSARLCRVWDDAITPRPRRRTRAGFPSRSSEAVSGPLEAPAVEPFGPSVEEQCGRLFRQPRAKRPPHSRAAYRNGVASELHGQGRRQAQGERYASGRGLAFSNKRTQNDGSKQEYQGGES
jgi:hypothetical protein